MKKTAVTAIVQAVFLVVTLSASVAVGNSLEHWLCTDGCPNAAAER